jgi:signal transduction histidine kinase
MPASLRGRETGDPKFMPHLKVMTRELGSDVEIRVRDSGLGIPQDIKEKLFQPFFTAKPTGKGTGLGLLISWDIVPQQHGSTIEVESQVGRFAEFTVGLPRRSPSRLIGAWRQSKNGRVRGNGVDPGLAAEVGF